MKTLIETTVFELRVDEDNCNMDILVDRSYIPLDDNIFSFNTNEDLIVNIDYKGIPAVAVFKHSGMLDGHELQIWKLVDGELEYICYYDTDALTKGFKPRTLEHYRDTLAFVFDGTHQFNLMNYLGTTTDDRPLLDIEKKLTSIY